jgi:hypothetical protein
MLVQDNTDDLKQYLIAEFESKKRIIEDEIDLEVSSLETEEISKEKDYELKVIGQAKRDARLYVEKERAVASEKVFRKICDVENSVKNKLKGIIAKLVDQASNEQKIKLVKKLITNISSSNKINLNSSKSDFVILIPKEIEIENTKGDLNFFGVVIENDVVCYEYNLGDYVDDMDDKLTKEIRNC